MSIAMRPHYNSPRNRRCLNATNTRLAAVCRANGGTALTYLPIYGMRTARAASSTMHSRTRTAAIAVFSQ